MIDKPLMRPYFLPVALGGVYLDFHDDLSGFGEGVTTATFDHHDTSC